jgi:hypothetical protein
MVIEFYDNVHDRYRQVEVDCSVLCGDGIACSGCPEDNGCLIVREKLPEIDPEDEIPF